MLEIAESQEETTIEEEDQAEVALMAAVIEEKVTEETNMTEETIEIEDQAVMEEIEEIEEDHQALETIEEEGGALQAMTTVKVETVDMDVITKDHHLNLKAIQNQFPDPIQEETIVTKALQGQEVTEAEVPQIADPIK